MNYYKRLQYLINMEITLLVKKCVHNLYNVRSELYTFNRPKLVHVYGFPITHLDIINKIYMGYFQSHICMHSFLLLK